MTQKLPPMYKGNPFPSGVLHQRMQTAEERLSTIITERNILFAYSVKVTAKFYMHRDGMGSDEASEKAKQEVSDILAWAPEPEADHGAQP